MEECQKKCDGSVVNKISYEELKLFLVHPKQPRKQGDTLRSEVFSTGPDRHFSTAMRTPNIAQNS